MKYSLALPSTVVLLTTLSFSQIAFSKTPSPPPSCTNGGIDITATTSSPNIASGCGITLLSGINYCMTKSMSCSTSNWLSTSPTVTTPQDGLVHNVAIDMQPGSTLDLQGNTLTGPADGMSFGVLLETATTPATTTLTSSKNNGTLQKFDMGVFQTIPTLTPSATPPTFSSIAINNIFSNYNTGTAVNGVMPNQSGSGFWLVANATVNGGGAQYNAQSGGMIPDVDTPVNNQWTFMNFNVTFENGTYNSNGAAKSCTNTNNGGSGIQVRGGPNHKIYKVTASSNYCDGISLEGYVINNSVTYNTVTKNGNNGILASLYNQYGSGFANLVLGPNGNPTNNGNTISNNTVSTNNRNNNGSSDLTVVYMGINGSGSGGAPGCSATSWKNNVVFPDSGTNAYSYWYNLIPYASPCYPFVGGV